MALSLYWGFHGKEWPWGDLGQGNIDYCVALIKEMIGGVDYGLYTKGSGNPLLSLGIS